MSQRQRLRPPVPGFVADYGPEFVRHILIAMIALLLAIPVRHVQETLDRLAHPAGHPAMAQSWPSRSTAPTVLLR